MFDFGILPSFFTFSTFNSFIFLSHFSANLPIYRTIKRKLIPLTSLGAAGVRFILKVEMCERQNGRSIEMNKWNEMNKWDKKLENEKARESAAWEICIRPKSGKIIRSHRTHVVYALLLKWKRETLKCEQNKGVKEKKNEIHSMRL